MANEVGICNQALGWLGANSITSFDDNSTEAHLCSENYAAIRDAVEEEGYWSFTIQRFSPAFELESPQWGYAYQFLVPTKVLRVVEVHDNSMTPNGGSNFDWRLESGRILCDSNIIFVKAIFQVTDPRSFSPTFVQCLAARLAADLAIPLTKSRSLQSDMFGLYQSKLSTALALDGSQGKGDRLTQRRYHEVR